MISGYAGKIKNAGTQEVKAPYTTKGAEAGTVKRGTDLRAKKGK